MKLIAIVLFLFPQDGEKIEIARFEVNEYISIWVHDQFKPSSVFQITEMHECLTARDALMDAIPPNIKVNGSFNCAPTYERAKQ